MGRRRVLPKTVAVGGILAIAAFLAGHVNAWFFATANSGSHVQQDFAQGGFTFTLAQRIAGASIEGLPLFAYALAFTTLFPLLWSPRMPAPAAERRLARAGWLSLTGAAMLAIYPVPASILFTALEPGPAGMFLVSLQPVAIAAVLGSLLFSAVSARVRDYLLT